MATRSGTRTSVIVSLLAWAVFLAIGSGMGSGGWTSAMSLFAAPQSAENARTPAVSPPAPSVTLDAADILAQAQGVLDRAEWLATDMRHQYFGPKSWSSTAGLQRGPKGCCRLESTLSMGGKSSRRIVVSDGKILAQSTVGQGPAKIESWPLPDDVAARDALLTTHNCGGPAPILAQARARGSDWSAHIAVHAGRPSIAISGTLAETAAHPATLIAKSVRLFLDAETLTLTRAEYWTLPEELGGTILLAIEFEKTRLNEALTVEQCIEAFTLRAE